MPTTSTMVCVTTAACQGPTERGHDDEEGGVQRDDTCHCSEVALDARPRRRDHDEQRERHEGDGRTFRELLGPRGERVTPGQDLGRPCDRQQGCDEDDEGLNERPSFDDVTAARAEGYDQGGRQQQRLYEHQHRRRQQPASIATCQPREHDDVVHARGGQTGNIPS